MRNICPELPAGALAALIHRMRDNGYIFVSFWRVIRKDGLAEAVYSLSPGARLLPEERIRKALESGPKTRAELSEFLPDISRFEMGNLLKRFLAAKIIKKQKDKSNNIYRLAGFKPVVIKQAAPKPLSRRRLEDLAVQSRKENDFRQYVTVSALYDRLFGDYVRAKGGRA